MENNENEIRDILLELKLDDSVKEYNKQMKNNDSNYHSTNKEIDDAFSATINDKIGPKITEIFHKGPLGELKININPDEKSAYYTAGTLDKRASVLDLAPPEERR